MPFLVCPLCFSSTPCSHRFDVCWRKLESERTFYRRDTIWQHVSSVHFKHDPKGFEEWRHSQYTYCKQQVLPTSKDNLVCHCCGFCCRSWDERALHIRDHFTHGITTVSWNPGGLYTPQSMA
ncbi:hypothetical protein F5Y16DRAFT_382904 [Xylariaceae sp. FL0255]|nr:hypothetical protein F5Y16DRAFT_382904 [Xylariaceae sp. FL0255]